MDKKNTLIFLLIDNNSQVQRALKKCSRLASDDDLKLYFRKLAHDFGRVNSILLDSKNSITSVECDALIQMVLSKKFFSEHRWLHVDSIFDFDNDMTLTEEVNRAIAVIAKFYQTTSFIAVNVILRQMVKMKRNSLSNPKKLEIVS